MSDSVRDIDQFRAAVLADPKLSRRYRLREGLAKLGDLYREMRQAQHRSQSSIAEKVGIDQGDVSRLENGEGERGPTVETLVKYADALELEVVVALVPRQTDKASEEQPFPPAPLVWAKL
ncbi:MAG TPA: helix-turn-helix transcriptional regulator [Paraburkholderia sp.]|uniref:helix-turn-helix domain-containing protein n=1 Tax=Paraburkholderia sp. TaxID=1926495 RepID=UPI002B476AE5|nr:helix-turn-helix transcriptional regulator [Paraburkholderia sp.]HKR43909.1 helix-turn-helix transcriptional regulator [Paraburkholderia sp.]